MAETTVDPTHMPVSLSVELAMVRIVPIGSRSEALAKMAADIAPELAYMQQRLTKAGFSATFSITEHRTERRCAPVDIEQPWERRLPLRVALILERDDLVRAIGSLPDDEAPTPAQVERLETVERLLGEP